MGGEIRLMSTMRGFGLTRIASITAVLIAILGLAVPLKMAAHAQTAPRPQPMITQPISEANLARLFGNTRPEVNAANDRGRLPDNFLMEHMLLQLRRPPAQEEA